jgi:AcrR family transcriptional regulator
MPRLKTSRRVESMDSTALPCEIPEPRPDLRNDRFFILDGAASVVNRLPRSRLRPVIDRVQNGVFFRVPDALPRGRHQLSREEVLTSQRERLMAALTELVAVKGFAAVGVGDVTERARVSRASFYLCFTDHQACAFAAYDRFIEVLLSRLAEASGGPVWEEHFAELVRAYLGTLQCDLVVARAFQVEMDAMGSQARERRRNALIRFARYIESERARLWTGDGPVSPLPLSAFVGIVYAARQLASDALELAPRPDLLALAPELTDWMLKVLSAHPTRTTTGASN